MTRIYLVGLIALTCFWSCTDEIVVSKDFEFPNNEWYADDIKSLEINAPDTSQAYQMQIRIHHLENYGFQNLYVRSNTLFPSGKKVSAITSLELAQADGAWSGECSSNTCVLSLPLQQRFRFPEMGIYKLDIEPYMRIDTIPGINRIEVICLKWKE